MLLENEEREKRALVVFEQSDGILPFYKVFYYHSILYSAGRCLDSFDRYEKIKNTEVSPDYLVSIVQEAIGHAAALSRYFWPSPMGKRKQPNIKKLKNKRGEKLCKEFGLTEASPLNNRDIRNAWEHFDEKMDVYLLEHQAGYFFPNCILDSHTLADEEIGHVFKLLDVEEECLVLLSEKYFFNSIKLEVESIYSQAVKLAK